MINAGPTPSTPEAVTTAVDNDVAAEARTPITHIVVRIGSSYCIRYARQHDMGVSILVTKLLIYY